MSDDDDGERDFGHTEAELNALYQEFVELGGKEFRVRLQNTGAGIVTVTACLEHKSGKTFQSTAFGDLTDVAFFFNRSIVRPLWLLREWLTAGGNKTP